GGLFGEGDEDLRVANAFRYAVYRVNHERDLLPQTRLVYDIQNLPVNDGFRASKKICYQVELNTVAVLGPRSSNLAGFVNSLCASLQLPHLELRMDTIANPAPGLSINLYPDIETLSKAFIDVIRYYGWKQMLVIYGTKDDLLKVQSVIRGAYDQAFEIMVRQVDKYNMRNVLKECKEKKWTKLLIDLSVDDTGLFLKMALQEGMIDPYHHYIISNLDIESIDMEDYRHNYVNLTGFRLVNPRDRLTQELMKDMEIYEMQTELKLLNKSGYLSVPHEVALIFDAVFLLAHALEAYDRGAVLRPVNVSCDIPQPWSSGPSLYTYLTQVSMRGMTGNIKLQKGRRYDFQLDILQLKPPGLLKSGTWKYDKGVNFTYVPGTKHMNPFGNKTLVVTTILGEPFIMEKKVIGSDGVKYEGFCIDLLNEIAKIVKFNYFIEKVPDGKFGSKDEKTGEWNGLVKQIIDRKADLAVAPLTISYVREQVIDFTKPFLNLGITILFKIPKSEKPGLFSFLNPLAIEIWLYVIGAYLLVSFTIFVLARFSPYEWYNPHPCNPDSDTVENTFNLANSFWFTVGTLMQQGSDVNPRAVSTRIVGGTWWFFTLIIISSYTANLAAFLTVERMVSPIESAEDLAKQTDILYGTLAAGSTMTFFRDSNIDIYKRMWAFMEENSKDVLMDSYIDGIDRVMKGNYAFFMESTSIDYVIQRNCELMQVGGLLDTKGYGIGTPIDSPYRDKLSMAILELQENGKIQMLYNKWWKSTGTCNKDDQKDQKANALGVENVGGIFVVLMAGLALAVMVAMFEFIWKSRKNAEDDRQSLCTEMAQELRFAIRCHGSAIKPKYKKDCKKCTKDKDHGGQGTSNSPNGIIQLKEVRKSPLPGREYETEFRPGYSKDFNGDYLHVDYSDQDA
ncbi:hypothetical protein LOTGIDRAFT_121144, partial [Lottia gigantea]